MFKPVTCLDTLRLLTAMAVQNNWEFQHLNIKTAYLHGDLEEEVYMAIPQGLDTGGRPPLTRQVHGDFMVSSETKCPTQTRRVHEGHFYN